MDDLPDRIAAKIVPDQVTGCWMWTGCTTGRMGYGAIWWDGKTAFAHRVTYHLLRDLSAPVFPGRSRGTLVLDHLCDNPRCVQPAHLRLCSNRSNVARRQGFSSPLIGVRWHKRDRRWIVGAEVGDVRLNWGCFSDEVVAGLRAIEGYKTIDPDTARLAEEMLVRYVADIQSWLEAAR